MTFGEPGALAQAVLGAPSKQPAKIRFVDELQTRYRDVERLNALWGTRYPTWQALLNGSSPPDPGQGKADLEAFSLAIAEEYFRIVREEVKKVAPYTPYLGCRFVQSWANDGVIRVAARYCDVLSYSIYDMSASDFRLPEGLDVPVLIGEFHFGSLDRGLFHPGLVAVNTQEDRARAYVDYVTGVLKHPSFVGCQWFQFQDEPATGRSLDGENWQIGFVDVADNPYPEIVAAARRMGASLYSLRSRAP